jgi:predicted ATPase
MSLTSLQITNYRSIRRLDLKPGPLNVVVGPNGCGKTNLYRSLWLLGRAAVGQLAASIVEEGGMPSVLWAGDRMKNERARFSVEVGLGDLTYELHCGVPVPSRTAFVLDPQVKEERIVFREGKTRVALMEREHTSARARDSEGRRVSYPMELSDGESILSQVREPQQFPALSTLAMELAGWRFYHAFRTDAASPIREPRPSVRTWALGHDGTDLAAALQTIREQGCALDEAIGAAFPGSTLLIEGERARLEVLLHQEPFVRPFSARELSDGTLHYLCLLAALLSPRPPRLLAFNEPEASLHPDLLPALAGLIADASAQSQVWVTTHSEPLAGLLEERAGARPIRLTKEEGATVIER